MNCSTTATPATCSHSYMPIKAISPPRTRIENTKSLKFLNFAPSSVNLVHWHWVKIVSQKCDAPYIVSQSDTKLHTDAEKDSKLLAI